MNLGEIAVELLADGALVPTILTYGSQYTIAATPQEDGSYINGTVSLVTPVSNTTVNVRASAIPTSSASRTIR